MYRQLTLADVLATLTPLAQIRRPPADNEGDPINGDSVFPFLTPQEKQQVNTAEEALREYTRTPEGGANRRAIHSLTSKGHLATLNDDQYDRTRLVGRVSVGPWEIDISDAAPEEL